MRVRGGNLQGHLDMMMDRIADVCRVPSAVLLRDSSANVPSNCTSGVMYQAAVESQRSMEASMRAVIIPFQNALFHDMNRRFIMVYFGTAACIRRQFPCGVPW